MGLAGNLLFLLVSLIFCAVATADCSNGGCQLHDKCSSHGDCAAGLFCFSCSELFSDNTCVRSTVTNQFSLLGPAIDTFKEIEAFLSANPTEIVTLILEDYVRTPNALTKVFTDAGLMKYWFPVKSMPQNGQDWPLVSDMIAKNQRLVVFTSAKYKENSEGIAYQWNYMVENQYGDGGLQSGNCTARGESPPLNDMTKSLVLVNYFLSVPLKLPTCELNSKTLLSMLDTCHGAAGNRWANFVAVDFYKRSDGGGTFQAVDTMNGELLCGSRDVRACLPISP
uniref:PI-PLC X domain-containing protein n=1 Tax=Vitis vinifera TaxID=29760 RepID=A5C7Z5_VITVI|nr:hypothetical protein VITISV_007143 [Vitis vinifera]